MLNELNTMEYWTQYSIVFNSETQLDSNSSADNYQSWEIGHKIINLSETHFFIQNIRFIITTSLGFCDV